MTDTLVTRSSAPPAGRAPVPSPGAGARPGRWSAVLGHVRRLLRRPQNEHARVRVAGQVVSVLAILVLGFAVHLLVLSHLLETRHQQRAYADLRNQLAIGTAPLSQLDAQGRLLALGTPVAVLEIPRLGLRQVVGEGTTSSVLADGPGHRRDTALPGQAGVSVVLGRRLTYGAPFRELSTLQLGDRITTATGLGKATYRVTGIRRAGDPLPVVPAADEGRLTLVTTDGRPWAPSGVLRIDAVLETKPLPSAPRVLTSAMLLPSEQVMGVDGEAVVPLLLWTQALLVAVLGTVWARARWGRRQAWVVGTPVLILLGLQVCDQLARLLPNLL